MKKQFGLVALGLGVGIAGVFLDLTYGVTFPGVFAAVSYKVFYVAAGFILGVVVYGK